MNANKPEKQRRLLLGVPFAAMAGWLLLPARRAHAQEKATLLAKPVVQIPIDPEDAAWQSTDILEVPLAAQAVVKPRTYEVGVKAIAVRALYDDNRLALRLEWRDAASETMAGGVSAFRDAIAVEFPADPKAGIPFFGMGEPNRPVTIYQWKSDWQSALNNDVDEKYPNMAVDWYPFSGRGPGEIAEAADYAKKEADKAFLTSWAAGNTLADPALQALRSVEKLIARGFGTIAPATQDKQDGEAKAVWKDGVWKAVVAIPRAQEQFTFGRGQTVPVAFAAWDGAKSERGGEKAVSTWYFLSLEQPIGALTYVAPLVAVVGAAAVELAGLRGLRARRAPRGEQRSFGAALRSWIADLRAKFARRGRP